MVGVWPVFVVVVEMVYFSGSIYFIFCIACPSVEADLFRRDFALYMLLAD
jgi:hypothetical protein